MKKTVSKYAITEIITTGLDFKKDRIIHLSTYLLNEGEIENNFTSFINPERILEPDWSRSVGILDIDLKDVPKFYEKAKHLLELWKECILISSNPRFTYTFIKNEYKALGFAFNHSYAHLNNIIDDDTKALFYPGCQKAKDIVDYLITNQDHTLCIKPKKDLSPKNYFSERIKELPNSCGVYLLKNKKDHVIYVGKAIKIRSRIRQHFRNLNNKGFNIHRKVVDIELCIDQKRANFQILDTTASMIMKSTIRI